MRTICAVTVGRSDWGIYRPVLQAIERESCLKLHLVAGGAHLVAEHGSTLQCIEEDGFVVQDQVDMLLAADTPLAVSKSMGLGTIGFASVYARVRPDILLLLGDRFEMHAAAVGAIPLKIPIAHIHGGEVSHGAIDDCLRHAITKYSHLHFPSTAAHAERIMQLGEEPWRITVSGAPGLDNLSTLTLLSKSELERQLEMELPEKPLLVCYHPVTLQSEQAAEQAQQLLTGLAQHNRPIVITRSNADSGNAVITHLFEKFCRDLPNAQLVDNLGTQVFFSLMNVAAAMVGNSSSGIIEAASFQLPVVNIGLRQAGRAQSGNVINADCESTAIAAAIEQAVSPEFRRQVEPLANIYGNGKAAQKIVEQLKRVPLNERLLIKQFYDLPKQGDEHPQAA